MYNEDKIIEKSIKNSYLSILKANLCMDLLEDIFTAFNMYPNANERFDFELSDVRDTLEDALRAVKYYKI